MFNLQSFFAAILLTLLVITNARTQDYSTVIEDKADAAGLELKQLSNRIYAIEIEMPSGNTQLVIIRKSNSRPFLKSTIEIQVPSINPDDLEISVEARMKLMILLMAMNTTLEVGFWAYSPSIERLTMMTNYYGDQFQSMTPVRFREILIKMVTVVDKIEVAIREAAHASLGLAGAGGADELDKTIEEAARGNSLEKIEEAIPEMKK